MKSASTALGTIAVSAAYMAIAPLAAWEAAETPLMTEWGAQVSPENVPSEYPRPQMVRSGEDGAPQWTNLNGLWSYAVTGKDDGKPDSWEGEILVPFPIESALSGVGRRVSENERLWYRRTFKAPEGEGRLLLHFGAVDWESEIIVNGSSVGSHRGGYDRFTLDITEALTGEAGAEQELVVSVWDPTEKGFQARGKQTSNPHGIWYTPVTGIWQTAWLERVPATRIESLRMIPDIDAGLLKVTIAAVGDTEGVTVTATAQDAGTVIVSGEGAPGKQITLAVTSPKLWSPDNPFLYDLEVRLRRDGADIDSVASYFGMRKIALGKDANGDMRLLLNNEPLFQFGPLDQGWWPDGLYAAPSDEALKYDVDVTRQLGFNMARKHVKVEPARWYYHADKAGLLVWQDLPNSDRHIGANDPDIERSEESAANYRMELREMIEELYNHPSIVVWVPFNEGWGQFETDTILAETKEMDPTRLVDGPSGWADRGTGDMHDMHSYPGPGMPEPEESRAVVLGEFGGLGLPMEDHLWQNRDNWGYRTYRTKEELLANYRNLISRLRPLIMDGLAAAVYTQTTDVEGEVNGLLTYDRKEIKLDPATLRDINASVYFDPADKEIVPIVATSRDEAQQWKFTTEQPAEGWEKPGFDDANWQSGAGGFGAEDTPGAVIGTPWTSPDIWIRRTFELDGSVPEGDLLLFIHHDEDADVFINGQKVIAMEGYTTDYLPVPLDAGAAGVLKEGTNTLAVHCRQTRGGQFIDVGLSRIADKAGR